MTWLWDVEDLDFRVSFARTHSPTDLLTLVARFLVSKVTLVLAFVLSPIDMVARLIGRGLVAVVLGLLLLLVLTAIWFPVWGLLVGTSWLWLKSWWFPARPVGAGDAPSYIRAHLPHAGAGPPQGVQVHVDGAGVASHLASVESATSVLRDERRSVVREGWRIVATSKAPLRALGLSRFLGMVVAIQRGDGSTGSTVGKPINSAMSQAYGLFWRSTICRAVLVADRTAEGRCSR